MKSKSGSTAKLDGEKSASISERRAAAIARQAELTMKLRQCKALAEQLVGELNQVTGEIRAYDTLGAK